jgi:hypothetical protein
LRPPELFIPFLVGVLSSLAATAVWGNLPLSAALFGAVSGFLLAAFALRRTMLRRKLLGNMRLYTSFAEAATDILRSASGSSRIGVVAIRGHHILAQKDSVFHQMLADSGGKEKRIDVLLLSPHADPMLRYLDSVVPATKVEADLDTSIAIAAAVAKARGPRVQATVRWYRDSPLWKLVLTDHHCFFIGYAANVRGHSLPLIRVDTTDNCFAVALTRYFEDLTASSEQYGVS